MSAPHLIEFQETVNAGGDPLETSLTLGIAPKEALAALGEVEPTKPTDAASLEAAQEIVATLPDAWKADPGALFAPEALQAIRTVKHGRPAAYQRLKGELKRHKAPLRDLDTALRRLDEAARADARSAGTLPGADMYRTEGGVLCRITFDREGVETPKQLCTFDARIVTEEAHDDGAEVRRVYGIAGTLRSGEPLPTVNVPAASFASMGWTAEAWGTCAFVYAGAGTADHLRAAILSLSTDVQKRTVYLHTGWRRVDGVWYYLHTGGAIGPDGCSEEVSVQLRERLEAYRLEVPSTEDELRAAVRASLSMIEVAPDIITLPLLAAVYRAPLAEAAPAPMAVFVEGQTGSQKSELTAMAQAHFGAGFHGKALPGNWNATANSLERAAFLAKDALFTVDDFCPAGADVQRLHRDADRLLRGAGNQAGRGRMNADGSLRPEFHARGVIASSGEEVPAGHSLRARLVTLSLRRGDVNLERLTALQRDAADGLLCRSVGGYVRWLASRMDDLKSELPKRLLDLRAASRAEERLPSHDRVPDSVASLALGWERFLLFARDVDAITHERYTALWEGGWAALTAAARAQADWMKQEDPTRLFVELLTSALSSGRAHLAGVDVTDEPPPHPERFGWRRGHDELRPMGNRIGWASEAEIMLDPEAAFAEVHRMYAAQGCTFPMGPKTLWKRLAEKQILVTDPGKNTTKRIVQGVRKRLLVLHPSLLSGMGAVGAVGADPHES